MLRRGYRIAPRHRFAAIPALLLLFATSPIQAQVDAQAPIEGSGFWLSLGAGSGFDIPGSLLPKRVPRGVAAFLRAGGSLSPQVLFGAEVIGRSTEEGDASAYRGAATFSLMVYPSRARVFFFKGGVGPAFVGESVGGGYRGTYTVGLAVTGGVGWDMHLLGNLYMTPSIDYVYQSFYAGEDLATTHRLLLGTVGLTWR